jgi:hypothetical protein
VVYVWRELAWFYSSIGRRSIKEAAQQSCLIPLPA